MSDSIKNLVKTNLGSALAESLNRRFPHNASSKHIEDIVNALLGSLSRGEIYLEIGSESKTPIEIKAKGWPDEHYKALLESDWLNDKNGPIILKDDVLSWRRWHMQMEEVIKLLRTKAHQRIDIDNEVLNKANKATKQFTSGLNDDQLLAVEKVGAFSLILLTGGPGTGKTSTVAKMLLKALSINPSLQIGLAAPTGKATRRLQESLQESAKKLSTVNRHKLSKATCSTLHKWLQAKEGGFIRNASNPLQLDLLVVDEMSMVDLTLMLGLTKALPIDSQLILVGDSNQLPPVGSGAIWHYLSQETNLKEAFLNSSIALKKVYRNRGDLAMLAELLNSKGIDSYWERLKRLSSSSNVALYFSNINFIPNNIINQVKAHHIKIKEIAKHISSNISSTNKQDDYEKDKRIATSFHEAFICLEELMVLCPRKHGLWSVEHVNKTLLGTLFDENISIWPEGVPIICGSNQPELGIANGDIGITIGEGQNRYLLFRVTDPNNTVIPKLIHPARLKTYDAAFAMTIHKAQGSEAKHVIMLWPNKLHNKDLGESTNNNYENRLIYTAITRAKETLDVFIEEDIKD